MRRPSKALVLLFALLIGVAGLSNPTETALIASTGTTLPVPSDIALNVKDYGAVGDGVTDDTAAIQAALNQDRSDPGLDYNGRPSAVYFPPGTYRVSNTLEWVGCCMTLQGQGTAQSIIKLANNAPGFNNPASPKPVLRMPDGNMSFRQNIFDLTVDTGSGNSGAVGIDYISNNWGGIRGVLIRGGGLRGLDMTRSWPGPLLVRSLEVQGFSYGIDIAHAEYGPTFEDITLSGQTVAGIRNQGNTLAIRRLRSTNSVPALIQSQSWAMTILLDSTLSGGTAANSALDITAGLLFARNVTASGYASAIRLNGTNVPGLSHTEYLSSQVLRNWTESPARSLNLPIRDVPTFHDSNLSNWARFSSAYNSGASNAALSALFTGGKPTIYFTRGASFWGQSVHTVPPHVRRIVAFGHVANNWDGVGLVLRVSDNSPTPLIIEGFGYGVQIEHRGARPVVLKHGGYGYKDFPGAGDLYLDDVGLDIVTFNHTKNVWARQLNTEGSGTTPRITNNSANLWIMGIKTEGNATVVTTNNGAKTEVLGTLIYPATSVPSGRPAFVNNESNLALNMSFSSYVSNGLHPVLVQETRSGTTRTLASYPRSVVLYTGYFAPQTPPDTVGVFRGSNSTFYLRNTNTTGFADLMAVFGASGDLPVAGDWNGDGIDTIGVFRNGVFFLKDANTTAAPVAYSLSFGAPGDLPVAGDWDGDGRDSIGVFRTGRVLLRNALSTGMPDLNMAFGAAGDRPVAGDWNYDGIDSPGVQRGAQFFLTDQVCTCAGVPAYTLTLGLSGDIGFGGDWNGDGFAGVGVFRPTNGLIYLRNALTTGFADTTIVLGIANDRPIAGRWANVPAPVTAPDSAPSFKPLR